MPATSRRQFFSGALGPAAGSLLEKLPANGGGKLGIQKVEPIVIRTSPGVAAHPANVVIIEGGTLLERPFGNDLLVDPLLPWSPSDAHVPESPGIGVEFDETELARYRVA